MSIETRKGGMGTELTVEYPFGWFRSAKVLCVDGKVRKVIRISTTPDTFYSVPAAVRVGTKAVSGYLTTETMLGYSTETDDDPLVYKFIAYSYGKNGHLLPGLAFKAKADA